MVVSLADAELHISERASLSCCLSQWGILDAALGRLYAVDMARRYTAHKAGAGQLG